MWFGTSTRWIFFFKQLTCLCCKHNRNPQDCLEVGKFYNESLVSFTFGLLSGTVALLLFE